MARVALVEFYVAFKTQEERSAYWQRVLKEAPEVWINDEYVEHGEYWLKLGSHNHGALIPDPNAEPTEFDVDVADKRYKSMLSDGFNVDNVKVECYNAQAINSMINDLEMEELGIDDLNQEQMRAILAYAIGYCDFDSCADEFKEIIEKNR